MRNDRVAASSALARRIKAGIAANVGSALRSSIGIAPNRLLAKMAADMEKPDGLTVLDAPAATRLRGLVPADIPGVGKNMERRLAAAGVVTMDANLVAQPARGAVGVGQRVGRAAALVAARGPTCPNSRRSGGRSATATSSAPTRARPIARGSWRGGCA